MRTHIVSVAAAASLVLAVVSSASAQVVAPPLSPLVRPAPVATPRVAFDEAHAVALLRARLAGRGFDASVAQGPMLAVPPGAATPLDFDGDAEMDAPLGPMQPEAYLVWTEGGRWWVWETGVAVAADQRGAVYEIQATRQAAAQGRYVGD